jgi:hypothetical protein
MKADLDQRFATYWDDMEECRTASAYWSLLHVTVCLPDICAALQSSDGRNSSGLYKGWCGQFAADPLLTGEERWNMRNKLLHQARARSSRVGRYTEFVFTSPSSTGRVDHKRVDGSVLHIDASELAHEMRAAVDTWIRWLHSHPKSTEAANVRKNLPSMVQVSRALVHPPGVQPFISYRTN